jgi:mevalonate kinase
MKNTVTVSAPGKLMLFGEHAVVYSHPCIVTAVGERISTTLVETEEPIFTLNAPDVNITNYSKSMDTLCTGDVPRGVQFIEHAINVFSKTHPLHGGITITTASTFSSLYGFGSSSAVTVCVLRGLHQFLNMSVSQKELFTMAYKTVLDVQGKGSGFDIASAIYGKTIVFETSGPKIEPIEVSALPLIVGYSGVKADTKTMIEEVKKKKDMYPEKVERIFMAIEKIVEQSQNPLAESDWERVGKLMTFNQEYLRDLGVSTEKLEAMISAAIKAGAYGAKLSGAGGGDCMIALSPPDKSDAVQKAIESIGGEIIPVTTNVSGVEVNSHE